MIHMAVFAMIIAVALQLISANQLLSLKNVLIITLSFCLFMFTKIHPSLIIIAAGLIGALWK